MTPQIIALSGLLVLPLGITKQEKFIKEITPLILEKSEKYELEPELVAAIIQVESSWHPRAESEAGACGLMQVIPKWNPKPDGKLYTCEELKDPATNIEAGTRALRWWLDRAKGDRNLALCAYNAGYACFKKMRKKYVDRVLYVYYIITRK
jgi:soluble lytic murein transglycosylase-like protein